MGVLVMPTMEEWFLGSMTSPMMIHFISPHDRKILVNYYGRKAKENPADYLDVFTKLAENLDLKTNPYYQAQAFLVSKYMAEFFSGIHLDQLKDQIPQATTPSQLEFSEMAFSLDLFNHKSLRELRQQITEKIEELKGETNE